MYQYNEETKEVTRTSCPKIDIEDFLKMEAMIVPTEFLEKINSMKFNIEEE